MTKSTLPGRLNEAIAQAEARPSTADDYFALVRERRASGATISLDDPVIYEVTREHGPGTVVFTKDELSDFYLKHILAWTLGEAEVRGLPGGYEWDEIINHELDHGNAAHGMGASGTEIGLEIMLSPDPRTGEPVPTLDMFFCTTLGWQTTNMGAIAVSLAPRTSVIDGGYGDALLTRYHGFNGTVREFGKLVVARNATLGPSKPKIILPPGMEWVEHPYDYQLAQVDKDLAAASL